MKIVDGTGAVLGRLASFVAKEALKGEEFVILNQSVPDIEAGSPKIVNDLSQGTYDVVVDVGPAYASQRQQGAEQLTRLAIDNPAFALHTPDLIAEALDIPNSKELARRLRREGVLNGSLEPTDDEREEFQLDLRTQIISEVTPQIRQQIEQEASTRLLNAEATNSEAAAHQKGIEAEKTAIELKKVVEETMNLMMDGLAKSVETNTKMVETALAKIAAGVPLTTQETDNLNSQDDIIEEQQQEVSPGPNSQQDVEFGLEPNI